MTQPPASSEPDKPKGSWWPQPSTPWGALLYAVLGSLIVWLLIGLITHVHVSITWR